MNKSTHRDNIITETAVGVSIVCAQIYHNKILVYLVYLLLNKHASCYVITMSIFTNRIISNAYMSMYKKKSPIMESYTYIYESAIDKNIHRADELADKIAHDIFGKYKYNTEVIGNNGHSQRYAHSGREMRYNAEYIKHLVGEKIPFSKDQKSKAKFFLGATRIFGDILKNAESEEDVNRKCSEFNKILGVIVNDSIHINEYDNNLNGLSLKDLQDKFGQKVKDISNKEKEEIASKSYIKNKLYTIIPCNTWEDIKQFGEPLTTWCVAQKYDGEYAYNSYTDNGTAKFYVCKRNDYESVNKVPGDNAPLDDYGLSMIAICVNPDGSLKTCTCRWNHENGGNDNIMDAKQISDLLGVNFFEVFKPRSPKEIFSKLEYDERDPLCSLFGFRYNSSNNFYYRLEDNKIINYIKCHNNPTKTCLANTHFEWYNLETGEKIDPPEYIDENFSCSYCDTLTSLEGSPNKVAGSFSLYKCNNLTSLKGAPLEVGVDFSCYNCKNIESLDGAPSKVGLSFDCSRCESLTSLNGAPSKVGLNFDCSCCKNLISLEGAPSEILGNFDCSYCNNLKSLEGAPKKVGGSFSCDSCKNLITLKGSPYEVRGSFRCSNCYKLTSFKGAPSKVGGDFYCYDCYKLSLNDGVPESIRGKIKDTLF